jgi:hypothetical protein
MTNMDFEDVHRKMRFGWNLVRTGLSDWHLINTEERVLHPVGKTIKLTAGAPNQLQRVKALKLLTKSPEGIVYTLCGKWNQPLEIK